MDQPDRTFDVARGDLGVSLHLKQSLTVLAAKSPDPDFRRLAADVLSGALGVRDLVASEAFNATLDRVIPLALADLESLSDEQRERLAAETRERMDSLAGSMGARDDAVAQGANPDEPADEVWNQQGGILSSDW
ncbi:hypothetical protein R1X32_40065 [Rhodococcus opacus]|uniref:hypothetical protein n=1 Tax=Rhodococcus opacus TaxID=37919 RepID=UPI001BB09538|nr:hypothetical protein [Rhodococcus opacus]MDV6245578.1 hypothetical protein [Rhodococcus opacus]WKN54261.1 hypothetical protein HJ581_0010910 [Rhodococcus opacus]